MDDSTQPSLLARITVAGSGQVFLLERFPVMIGRSEDCEVRLEEPSGQATLSRRHARLSLGSGRLRLEDLSTNGTQVGGHLLNPGELRLLNDREEVRLGAQLQFVVETLRPGPSPPPAPLPTEEGAADARLRLQALGHFQAHWAGQPISETAWGTRKPILLLTYLAWQGERPVAIDRVCSELWPDNAQGGRQALQSTLARIRRGLKPMDPVLLERGAYRLNPELNTYLDATALLQAAKQPQGEARIKALASVRSLYRGSFLEGFSEDWVCLRRQDLEQQYLCCMAELCQHLHSQQQWKEAAELCREVLEVESCWEPGHQGLIKGMLELGQRDEAVRHYHRYVEIMKAQLSLPPSPEMLRLYFTLLDR